MIDPRSVTEQAELAAAMRQQRQERRQAVGLVGLALLVSLGPPWLGLVLGAAVRLFNFLAWGG